MYKSNLVEVATCVNFDLLKPIEVQLSIPALTLKGARFLLKQSWVKIPTQNIEATQKW